MILLTSMNKSRIGLSSAMKSSKKKNKSIPAEESQDIWNVARGFLKDILFCTNRLTNSSSPGQVKSLMKKVYDGIKKEMGFKNKGEDKLEFSEFHQI